MRAFIDDFGVRHTKVDDRDTLSGATPLRLSTEADADDAFASQRGGAGGRAGDSAAANGELRCNACNKVFGADEQAHREVRGRSFAGVSQDRSECVRVRVGAALRPLKIACS